ncbi:MAG: endonuclease/exonuclease/phosphatase family protein [Anaerolineae bacterium]|nr:endonuclease/exonuclease/phosphatase family protein [Anaerolineae bacterium]
MRFALTRRGIYQVVQKTVAILTLIYAVCFLIYLAAYSLIGDRFWPLALLNTFAYAIFIPLVVLLPLTFLARSRIGLIALLPIIVVLIIWAFPYFKTRSAVPAKNAIRIVTSNTLWDNAKRDDMLRWLRDTDADIIFLQEISYDSAAQLETLKDSYPYHPVSIESDEWGGNFILSRIPILSFDYIDLGVPKSMQPQRITAQVNGLTFAAYNIHLEWPMNSERPLKAKISRFSPSLGFAAGYDDSIRNLQIERLATHLQSEPYPYFMAGDFNTSDQSPSYNRLAAVGIDSFREGGIGFGATWPVAAVQHLPSFVPPLIRIDYVFHSDRFRALSAEPGKPMGSDHLPLFVTLEMVG